MSRHQDRGFTLVELLVVIVVLGVLAGVTTFAVRGVVKTAEDNVSCVETQTIRVAIESHFTLEGSYPLTLEDLSPGLLKDEPTEPVVYVSDGDSYSLDPPAGVDC